MYATYSYIYRYVRTCVLPQLSSFRNILHGHAILNLRAEVKAMELWVDELTDRCLIFIANLPKQTKIAGKNTENLKQLKLDDEDLISLWRPGIINFTVAELMERLNQEYLAVTWFKMEDLNEVVRSTADHCCNIFMVCGMFAGRLRLCSCMVSVQWFDAMLLHRVGNILQARAAMKKKSEFVFMAGDRFT